MSDPVGKFTDPAFEAFGLDNPLKHTSQFNIDPANVASGYRDIGFSGQQAQEMSQEFEARRSKAEAAGEKFDHQGEYNQIWHQGNQGQYDSSRLDAAQGTLQLARYEGDTDVPLSAGDKEAIQLSRDLLSGDVGIFRDQLEGQAALGHAESLINLGRTERREHTLPQVRDAFSGGPLGSGFNTGARRAAEAEVEYQGFAQNQAIRAQAFQQAEQQALQAAGMLPQMASVISQERANNIMNKERELATFYQNQGLSVAEFQGDMSAAQFALNEDMFDFQQMQYRQAREDQEDSDAGLWGSVGSLAGMGIGALLAAPTGGMSMAMGASLGSSLGSGLGLLGGGATNAGYQTLAQVPQQAVQMNMMNKFMSGGMGSRSVLNSGFGGFGGYGDSLSGGFGNSGMFAGTGLY